MTVLNKKAFKLPFIGTDKFGRLTRMGLGYDRGFFHIKNYNNVEKIIDFISDVLGEKISFLQTCILCGKDFPCSDCKYNNLCATKDLPLHCICPNCLRNAKLYDRYIERNLSVK